MAGIRRLTSRAERTSFALRNLVMALAHNARQEGKEALADELEAIEESLQRDFQPRRTREKDEA